MAYEKVKSENYNNFGGLNTKVSKYDTQENEFIDLSNFDFSVPGSLSKRPGSTLYVGGSIIGPINSINEYQKLNGFSQVIVGANTNLYTLDSGTFNSIKSGLLNNGIFDAITFVDRYFTGNGQDFLVYDGASTRAFSLPPGTGLTFAQGVSNGSGMSGIFQYGYGYLNERGFFGAVSTGITVSATGVSTITLSGFTTPTGYGITAIVIYRTDPNLGDLFRIGYLAPNGATFIDNNLETSDFAEPDYLWFTMAPKYLEVYNNQLFMAGFSGAPSTVYFSDIGEPEGIQPTSFFEVRTNDADMVTGLKSYNSKLMVFKQFSFHEVSGDTVDNISVRQISDQYGCLNNRAIAVYEQYCNFLDPKGIIRYTGANIEVLSTRVEPVFLSMNINSARNAATAIHAKLRNEIWFAIPYNGATLNNLIVAYDYAVNAFTKYDGPFPSSLGYLKATFSLPTAFYGSYSGTISYFGSSFLGDNGSAINCHFKTRFLHDMGNSVTKQFRRFYVDLDPVIGSTSALNISFYTDYSTTAGLTRTMYQAPFQSRIDFGLPAKSMAVELSNNTATDPVRIHGFTIESRFQRAV